MDINDIKVGKRYWWNGCISIPNKLQISPIYEAQIVRVSENDKSDFLPIRIITKNEDEHWVSPDTLSPLPEVEDAEHDTVKAYD